MRTINYKHLVVLAAAVVVAFSAFPVPAFSQTVDELQKEIDSKTGDLNKKKSELTSAEKRLKSLQYTLSNAKGEIPRLEAEIAKIGAEIDYNNLQLQVLSKDQELKKLEYSQLEVKQRKALTQAYRSWRKGSSVLAYLSNTDAITPARLDAYQSAVLSTQGESLKQLYTNIEQLDYDIAKFKEETAALEKQNAGLRSRKAQLEAQIFALNGSISAQAGSVAGLRTQVSAIQSSIEQLSAEQKALQNYEAWVLGQSGNGGTKPIQPGQYYLTGRGRDLYQGHGVGMSQFGAFGAARAGWSAEKIVTFYYSNTDVVSWPGKVSVQGYGTMDSNKYVAGLGEVPSKACGTAEQAAERPDKYVVDRTNTIWDCWPEEAIKAQVIAARSYARSYSGTICTTASCQVYVGGNAKQWAADETKDMVIVSRGSTHTNQIIRALYSSDNNQGYGTANNDTVFSNFSGDGTPYSYLRAKNDSGFAYRYAYTNWGWRTDGFKISDLSRMLSHVNRNNSLGSSRNFVNGILSDLGGEVAGISFERDPSQRVKKVRLTGKNGNTRVMAGWLFKSIWNSWVGNELPHGEKDFIYSLTFYLLQK